MADPRTTATPAPPVGDKMLDALTSGYKWNLGADRTIDWSVSGGLNGERFSDVEAMRASMEQALNVISSFANIKFHYVGTFENPDLAAAAGSEINLFLDSHNEVFDEKDKDEERGPAVAGAFPPNSKYGPAAGDIVINMNTGSLAKDLTSFAPGSYGFQVLLHEIGHTLGLKHPFEDKDEDDDGRPTFKDADEEDRDNTLWTVMSYGDVHYGDDLNAYRPATPMVLDVLALQSLYGANTTAGAGDTVIRLNVTRSFQTVWDPSGSDTIDVSNSTEGWKIDLPWTNYASSLPRLASLATTTADWDNWAKAPPDTVYWLVGNIENIRGSDFADDLVGNALANTILGGGGDDTIWGGAGDDYLRGEDGDDTIFGGSGFDDINGNRGRDTVHGGSGNDWVVGGQDEDKLNGGTGDDIVYGNLGSDTVYGGDGDDWVRGGLGNDILEGGAGNDFLSGDRGADTITGGTGADRFNLFVGTETDWITDFRPNEGDRISIEGNLAYTVTSGGGNTVISLSTGDNLFLVGIVSLSPLGDDWLWKG